MFCEKCGTANDDGARFCKGCGADMSMTNQPEQAAQEMPQNNYGAPVYNSAPVPVQEPGRGMAIASLVLGIISFLCFAIITGPLAIIFGAIAKSQGNRSGMATAGIICGAIGVGLYVILLALGISMMPF